MYIRINNLIITLFLILIFSRSYAVPNSTFSDIQIIKSDQSSLIFEWQPQEIMIESNTVEGQTYKNISFLNGDIISEIGAAGIPWRILTIGVPSEGIQSVQITNFESKTLSNIKVSPVPHPYKDSKGITNYSYVINDMKYSESAIQSKSVYQLLDSKKFRDFNVQKLMLTPFSYDAANQNLIVHSKIRVEINFTKSTTYANYKKSSKFDIYYKDFILNFEAAKNWQIQKQRLSKLGQTASLPSGPFYRIPVTEDGLYKISVSTLQNSGISLDNININSIQMFNNGGHILSYKVNDEHYNPPYTMEIPISVFDQNNNNIFDGTDYIIFYGKAVDSWFYDPNTRSFSYQKHPYATVNYYLVTFTGVNGKRMNIEPLTAQAGFPAAEYHIKRYHFEEDKYNLLASGPDWYGYRFFGTSGSYSKTMTVDSYNSNFSITDIRIKFKGGSNIDYNPSDNKTYRYYFTLYLNNHLLLNRVNFTDSGYNIYTKRLSDPSMLLEEQNVFKIQYEGNWDACTAYLDWIEILHPATFSATENYFNFCTHYFDDRKYTISNLSGNEFYIFDVTNPIEPKILMEDISSQNGQISFDIAADTDLKNLIISSLNSPEIKRVESLESYGTKQDLLESDNQADFIIITHKTFVPYAEEIAQLRDHLSTKIVTMEDIYFNFNSTVPDPTAIRNFLKYAYNNWQEDKLAYVLFFGDGHYDYRNISLEDTMRVPPFEIYDETEIDSRTSDNYYVDFSYMGSNSFTSISPELAIGRLPMESTQDAEIMVEKLKNYEYNSDKNGWQVTITLVGDDEKTTSSSDEWQHQGQSEQISKLAVLSKFIIKKIYLSAYESVPGGFGVIKPKANRDLIDAINQGSLIVNYIGHGSPRQWAHESVFNMSRDLTRINNPGRLSFFVAATCDFGKYDDPVDYSFTEALIWKKNAGAIGLLDAVRLVYSAPNAAFTQRFYQYLFPIDQESQPLGIAKLLATKTGINDQKYHLFADPTMVLADPKSKINITSLTPPDTLKALSEVEVNAEVLSEDGSVNLNFNGGAVLIVNDAIYDSVNTGGTIYYTLPGPTLFKGEVSVSSGILTGKFIVPKSIRFENQNTGRLSIFAWDDENASSALASNKNLLFLGSTNIEDSDGPDIDIYFEGQENFNDGDLIPNQPVLIAELDDENGINMTGETGHIISLKIDESSPKDISGYFVYEKNSYTDGYIRYPMDKLDPGIHTLKLSSFDNVNNPSEQSTNFKIAAAEGLVLMNVFNYPNPFKARSESTRFTFEYQTQDNRDAEVKIKIYTIAGRLIQTIEGNYVFGAGYEEIEWDGRDRDGDQIANGVYLYKLILDDGMKKKEVIEKLMIMN